MTTEIKNYIARCVKSRDSQSVECMPSEYWDDFVGKFSYLWDLSDAETQKIRYHTYHLTSDIYLSYYTASPQYRALFKAGYEYFVDNWKLLPVNEGSNGIGCDTKYGKVSHDLLRYLGIVCDLLDSKMFSVSRNGQMSPVTSRRILEIGGGYGGLARIITHQNPGTSYFICDLEETLIFSYLYLCAYKGKNKVVIVDRQITDGEIRPDTVYLVAQSRKYYLDGCQYDLTINQQSFQEMTTMQVDGYLSWISGLSTYLYSCNVPDHGELGQRKGLINSLPDFIRTRFGEPVCIRMPEEGAHRFGDNTLRRELYRTNRVS